MNFFVNALQKNTASLLKLKKSPLPRTKKRHEKHVMNFSKESGENIKLAAQEVISILGAGKYSLLGKTLAVSADDLDISEFEKRLAFTKSIHRLLFQCSKNLIRKIKNYGWNSVYNENFCVRIINNRNITNFSEKSLAGNIWSRLKNPKVNLENPKTLLTFFFYKDKIYCGLLLRDISHDFNKRSRIK